MEFVVLVPALRSKSNANLASKDRRDASALSETFLSGHSGNDYLFHLVLITSIPAIGVWFTVVDCESE